ncbi:MAG: M48 family metallopeptidase, partial [Verrucomicrobiia bacterium]
MLDFFERQESARKKTRRLLIYFILAVFAIIAAIYLAAALVLLNPATSDPLTWWDADLFLLVTVLTALTITLGSSIKTFQLAKGGRAVAEMLGGKLVSTQTADPEERRLLNVVEEMAIASGTPVPPVYVLEQEHGINAFAAGHDTSDAAIGVTRGCIHLLSRDELQGVIAHEFSHILNGDMALNMRLTCLAHGILFIAMAGYLILRLPGHMILHSGRNRDRKGGVIHPGILLGIIGVGATLVLIGMIGVFFANLIKAAISRQREFLADAAAVQFTRNPDGIGNALKKIGGWTHGSKIGHPQSREASHFFFGDGLGSSWFNLFATHPPLAKRIRLLDPSFTGTFPKVTDTAPPPVPSDGSPSSGLTGTLTFPDQDPDRVLQLLAASSSPERAQGTIAALAVAAAAAPPSPLVSHQSVTDHLDRLRRALTPQLRQALNEPLSACAIVFLLLTADEPDQRPDLFAHIDPDIFTGIHHEMDRLSTSIDSLPSNLRLSLIDLCLPALRSLAPCQFNAFRQTLQSLIEADGTISLFEYVLDKLLIRHLDAYFHGHTPIPVHHHTLIPVLGEVTVLLSTLAYLNQENLAGPTAAYQAGFRQLNLDTPIPPILPQEN